MRRLISSFLIILFFLQSCYTYQRQPTDLSKTVDTGRVKVEYQDGNKLVVKNIIFDEDEYLAKYHGKLIKLNNDYGKKYYMLDKEQTRTKSIGLVVGAITVPALVLFVAAIIIALQCLEDTFNLNEC